MIEKKKIFSYFENCDTDGREESLPSLYFNIDGYLSSRTLVWTLMSFLIRLASLDFYSSLFMMIYFFESEQIGWREKLKFFLK